MYSFHRSSQPVDEVCDQIEADPNIPEEVSDFVTKALEALDESADGDMRVHVALSGESAKTGTSTVKGQRLTMSLSVIVAAVDEDDSDEAPDNTLPGGSGGTPDQGLPGEQPGIDNTLPGSQPGVDNTLPGQPGRPDQGLPGDQPGIDNTLPRPGGKPDQGLPGDQPKPDQGLPQKGVNPDLNPNLNPDAGRSGNKPDQGLPPHAQPKK